MLFRLAADALVLLHLAFILLVLFGGLPQVPHRLRNLCNNLWERL